MSNITFDTFDETSKPKYSKTNFLDLSFGLHQVRLLGSPKRIFVHYFKGKGSIQCLGSDCPICKINKSLQAEYPENFRQQPGYNASSPRHYINILDRSPVKVCTNTECQFENKMDLTGHFPTSCKCGTFIGDVPITVSGKVKVANISETNAEKLMALQLAVRDDNGDPVGLANFDVEFVVTNSKGKKDISVQVSSRKNAYDAIEVPPEDSFYDLDSVVIKLEPDEVIQFIKGVNLKDLFAARRAESSIGSEPALVANADATKTIEDQLKKLGF